MSGVPHIGADAMIAALPPRAAVDAISAALIGGFDPADDLVRSSVNTAHGQFLLMPSEHGAFAGVKVVTVAPDNPSAGLPRIQGIYLMYDAATLSLVATMDGAALTSLRTPAVSFAAVQPALSRIKQSIRVVLFGAGPQALAHLGTLIDVAEQAVDDVTFIVRHPERVDPTLLQRGAVTRADSSVAREALAVAHIVICATTAREPLFPSDAVASDAIVIAVGSHEPDARELPSGLLSLATVVVEDIATAVREAGDIVLALAEHSIEPSALTPMKDIITRAATVAPNKPVVFKSVGMPWQDLAVAAAVLRRVTAAAIDRV